jgi:hypothetical protein
MKTEPTEFGKFDAAVGKILTVSHKELQAREKEWKRQKQKKRRKADSHK